MWSLCDNLNYEYPCVRIILQTNGYANNRLKIYKNKDENSHRFAILGELFERERGFTILNFTMMSLVMYLV